MRDRPLRSEEDDHKIYQSNPDQFDADIQAFERAVLDAAAFAQDTLGMTDLDQIAAYAKDEATRAGAITPAIELWMVVVGKAIE